MGKFSLVPVFLEPDFLLCYPPRIYISLLAATKQIFYNESLCVSAFFYTLETFKCHLEEFCHLQCVVLGEQSGAHPLVVVYMSELVFLGGGILTEFASLHS